MTHTQNTRPRGRPFAPGTSGNPSGRPRNTGKLAALREAVGPDAQRIIRVMTDAALNGDTQAARIVLDRCVPALRPVEAHEPVELPGGNPVAQASAVAQAVAAGEMSPAVAGAVLAALDAAARLEQHAELAARIERLELMLEGSK
jgi:hypothetical protein